MIYVIGVIGFIGGFALGQMILLFLLRNVSREELLNDPYLRWKYGTLNWLVAILSCYVMIRMYEYYF